MRNTACWTKFFLAAILGVFLTSFGSRAIANDLPLAAASPLTGVAFDDRPLLLPVQRNFQMAMLTAGSELGRTCGRMEAYGWRMGQAEQGRVNQIFNNTVDRLRLLGYTIKPQSLTSVSSDITLYTADKSDRHFIFLWSAGELGLVMNLCETTAPLAGSQAASLTPSVQTFPVPMDDVVSSHLGTLSKNASSGAFTPVGEWVGSYTCAQGYTGGTLDIKHAEGQNFDGVFKFYPTYKNESVPAGSYAISGQYDIETKRFLVNPGKWIVRPRNFYNTVIVGSFDASNDMLSAMFQGVSGCTSFEAKRVGETVVTPATKKHKAIKPKVKKKPTAQKPSAAVTPAPVSAPVDTAPPSPAPISSSAPAPMSSSQPLPVINAPQIAPPAAPTPAPPPAPVSSAAPAQAPTLAPEDKKDPGGIMLGAPTK